MSNKPEEIASDLRKIYESKEKEKLNKQFRLEPVKEYSWESRVEKLESVIKNVIDN